MHTPFKACMFKLHTVLDRQATSRLIHRFLAKNVSATEHGEYLYVCLTWLHLLHGTLEPRHV